MFLSDFRVIRPKYESPQEYGIHWLAEAHTRAERENTKGDDAWAAEYRTRMERLITRFGCGPDRIATRGYELGDFSHSEWSRMQVLGEANSGMEGRMRFFAASADAIFERFYVEEVEAPDALLHVSCTGYVSPSSAQKLVIKKGWSSKTAVTHAYHMGCYASLPAIRIAGGFLASGMKRADLVHTELCTLHLNPKLHTPEQLVVQSLFADGFIRYSATSNTSGRGFKVHAVHEEIVPDSLKAMEWFCADEGMHMTLSKDVPALIEAALPGFMTRLYARANLPSGAENKALFAIHPGGPKIIDHVSKVLGVDRPRAHWSHEVLKKYGNMSSATLPHVWQSMVNDEEAPIGSLVVSLAFGPGLTVCGGVFEKV